MKWTTKDGRSIEVRYLGDKHLVNILKICEESLGLNPQASAATTSLSDARLGDIAIAGMRIPTTAKVTQIDRNSDGTTEYRIVDYDHGPHRFFRDDVLLAGRRVHQAFVTGRSSRNSDGSARAEASRKKIPDDRLKLYGECVLEAVRRGLFDWSVDRKYLSATEKKITAVLKRK